MLQWYRESATQGIAVAQFCLGRMYLEGLGVDADLAEAALWILRSAQNGHQPAYHEVAYLYWEGISVVRNPIEAYKWWRLSSMHGNGASDVRLTVAKADMTSSQIEEASSVFVGTYIPKDKRTNAGLYITAAAAFAKWNQEPERFTIVDVRTPEEYFYIGHPPMARNIPMGFFTGTLSPDSIEPEMRLNNRFLTEVRSSFESSDHILLICRSGVRSAFAANELAAAGFHNVYNIVDGFEGDRMNVPSSRHFGKRVVNGWKNSGAPWTYEIDPGLVYKHPF